MPDELKTQDPSMNSDARVEGTLTNHAHKRYVGKEHAMRQVLVCPGEDGYYVVECPSLPGCISQGENKEIALENIRDAIHAYTQALRDQGHPIPEEKFDSLFVAV